MDCFHCEMPLGPFYKHTCMQTDRNYVCIEIMLVTEIYFMTVFNLQPTFAVYHHQCTLTVKAIILGFISGTIPIVHFNSTDSCIQLYPRISLKLSLLENLDLSTSE